jgi:transposase
MVAQSLSHATSKNVPTRKKSPATSTKRAKQAQPIEKPLARPAASSTLAGLAEAAPAEPVFIGVDVSKSWIDIADTKGRKTRVANESEAIKAAFTGVWSRCASIVCEATGGYERTLMQVARDEGLPLRRVHPNRARSFAKATAQLAKTDALDARTLARFAAFSADEPWAPLPDPKTQELADMVSRLTQLSDLYHSEHCRVKQAANATIKASIVAVTEAIKAQMDAMQQAIDAFIAAEPVLRQNVAILRSCKGVGPKSAQAIVGLLPEIGQLNRRAIAALVGVAPITTSSGSSINRASIRGGRKALRDMLYMAALSASSYNPPFKVFYERLRAKGKPHKLALIAVLRKLITTLNAMVKTQKMFNNHLT